MIELTGKASRRRFERTEGVSCTRPLQVEGRTRAEVLSEARSSLGVFMELCRLGCLEQTWWRACEGSEQSD